MADAAQQVTPRRTRVDRRREVAERGRDWRKRRIALALIGFFLLLIVGILIAGYVIKFVLPPRQLVVRVNEVEYTRGDMVNLLRAQQGGAQQLGMEFNSSESIFNMLNLLIEDEIITQSAPRFGIFVSDDEVEDHLRRIITGDLIMADTPPSQIEREFKELYKSYLNNIHLSSGEHRKVIKRQMLRERFRQFIGESVPAVAEQLHVYSVGVVETDEIDVMLTKFKDAVAGSKDPALLQEAFKGMVREFSRGDPESIRKGGELGWLTEGITEDYDHIIFDLEIGELSEPVPSRDSPGGILFFMISEKDLARELSSRNRDILKTRALSDWLNEERDNHDTFSVFNSDIYAWIVKQLGLTAVSTPTPQAGIPGLR